MTVVAVCTECALFYITHVLLKTLTIRIHTANLHFYVTVCAQIFRVYQTCLRLLAGPSQSKKDEEIQIINKSAKRSIDYLCVCSLEFRVTAGGVLVSVAFCQAKKKRIKTKRKKQNKIGQHVYTFIDHTANAQAKTVGDELGAGHISLCHSVHQ